MEVLQRTANRGSISTGYDVDNSLKFEAANNESLQRAAVTGNRRTFTQSCWLKRSAPGLIQQFICYGSFHHATRNYIGTDDKLYVDISGTPNEQYQTVTNRLFRDPSAWYHIVVAIDTTQATESNRLKIYVNGVQETSFAAQSIPAQNFDTLANIASSPGAVFGNMGIGAFPNAGLNNRTNGYLAEAINVDGQALDPTSFGEFDEDSGIWKPIDVSGLSFGNNGYYLDFKDSSNLGNDVSGGTDWTENNITAADQAVDTPTNNFCTLNPVYQAQATKYHTVSNGGTFVTGNQGGTAWDAVAATIPLFKGKWYWEIKKNGTRAQTNMLVGVGGIDEHLYNWRTLTTITDGAKLMFSYNGVIYGGGSGGFSYDDVDIISIALDQDNGGFYLRKNGGTWTNSGDPASGSSLTGAQTTPWGTSIPAFNVANNVGGLELNFGGFDGFTVSSGNSDANGYGNFEYAPPSGYYAICTKNLAEYG